MKAMLELNLKDSYIEYIIDQWIHCLYLQPIPQVHVQVDDIMVKCNLELLLANKIQTPSLVQKVIPHYLNSWEYFPNFVRQLLHCTKSEVESKSKKPEDLKALYYQGKERNQWAACSTLEEAIAAMLDFQDKSTKRKRIQRRHQSRTSFGRAG
jgi:hypothetical protein